MRLIPSLRTVPMLLAIAIIAGLSGCLETGMGDPATAPADARLEGTFQAPDQSDQLLIRPWGDGHTYAVSEVGLAGDSGNRKVGRVYKAWLAKVADRTFITIDSTPGDLEKNNRPFVVGMIEFRGGDIVAKGLDADFVNAAKTPADLEKLVHENLNNPKLWAKAETVYKRVTAK
jgi:hypothetical protein